MMCTNPQRTFEVRITLADGVVHIRRVVARSTLELFDRIKALTKEFPTYAKYESALAKEQGVQRYCCDHRCMQGRRCPSFAPIVIDGPYLNRKTAALKKWLLRCAVLMYLLAVVWVALGRLP